LNEVRAYFQDSLEGSIPIELSMLLNFVENQRAGKLGRAREAVRNKPVADNANQAQEERRAA
ncbi:MAG: acyl-ACP--UDP-N-acetylglucosamine O-acyltransferase, partial [Planctomycetota bacterium]